MSGKHLQREINIVSQTTQINSTWIGCLLFVPSEALRKSIVAAAVLCVHVVALLLLVIGNLHAVRTGSSGTAFASVNIALLPIENSEETIPPHLGRADLAMDIVDPDSSSPIAIPLEIEVPVVVLPELRTEPNPVYRAPQIDSAFAIDSSQFAREAGLPEGKRVSVVLTVEVGFDGLVGTVSVTQGSGDSRIDAAAQAYARALHWVAGSVGGEPKSLRTQLTVTLIGTV